MQRGSLMKTTIIFLQVLSFATGIVAAYFWYMSSRVEIIPPRLTGDPNLEHLGWTVGTIQAFSQSSNLSRVRTDHHWSALPQEPYVQVVPAYGSCQLKTRFVTGSGTFGQSKRTLGLVADRPMLRQESGCDSFLDFLSRK